MWSLFLGILLTYLFRPWIQKLCSPGAGKGRKVLAVGICYLSGLVILAALLFLLYLEISKTWNQLDFYSLGKRWEEMFFRLQKECEALEIKTGIPFLNLLEEGKGKLQDLLQTLTGKFALTLGDLLSFLGKNLLGIVFSFYFLLEEETIRRYGRIWREAFLDPQWNVILQRGLLDVRQVFTGYFKGQGTDAWMMGLLFSALFLLLRIPLGLTLGVLSGIGNLIPYIGPLVAYGGCSISLLFAGRTGEIFPVIFLLMVVQFMDTNWLNPKLVSKSLRVHPFLVVLAVAVGNSLGGIPGMFLGVPVAAWLKLQLERWLHARIRVKEKNNPSRDS